MELSERELIRQKFLDPELAKFIDKTDALSEHKNLELSIKSRQAGNLLYCRKNHSNDIHQTILNFYSMSIAFAPTGSEALALGYSNRSALLLHLKSYQNSIQDIDKSLAITKSNVLKVKLLCRKADCLITLGSSKSFTVFYQAVQCHKNIDVQQMDDKDHTYEVLTKTKKRLDLNKVTTNSSADQLPKHKPQQQINDFSSVDIRNSKKYGRHLIAARHINPGEIVYIEKPHVVCSGSQNLYLNCTHCLAIAWNGVPCKHCNWSIFCSTKCRKEAWMNYHFVECSVITHMIELNRSFSQNFQMSLRAVIMAIKESGGVAKLKADIESMNACQDDHHLQDLLSAEKSESNKFCNIFNLSSSIKDKHFEINIFNAAIALSYAAKYTTLFGKNLPDTEAFNGLADNENVLFTGYLLLKLVQISNNYGYSLSTSIKMCKHANETVRCFKKYCKDKVSYLAPVSSLINNSCIPNVRRIFTNDQKIIVYALDYIPKNDQIFESYISSFYETPRTIDRKVLLSKNFNFICDCGACLNNWSSLIEVFETEEVPTVSLKSSMSDLRVNFLENQLEDEYRELTKQAADVNSKCDEKTILELRKAIDRASALLALPSKIRCTLLFSLRRVFDKMYGNDPKLFSC